MHEHFFQVFGLRENPFHVSPDPRCFHSASVHASALTELTMGVDTQQGVIVLIGEAGTGKTVLLQHLLNWLRATIKLLHISVAVEAAGAVWGDPR